MSTRLNLRAFTAGMRGALQGQSWHGAQPRPPRTAVLGADGFLGRHLWATYRRWHPDTLGTTRRGTPGRLALDLTNPAVDAQALADAGYQAAVLPAALTNIARCQREPDLAWQVNVEGPLAIARRLAHAGITTIVYSTDYVFDGQTGEYDDDAAPCPVNQYGRTKAELERRLPEACGDNYLILRLSKVYGRMQGDGTLLDEMFSRMLAGQTVAAAGDQVFCPTTVEDVVAGTLALQAAHAKGLFNLCAPQRWARYDIACAVAQAIGMDPARVKRMHLVDLNEDFVRPTHTDMVCRKLAAAAPAFRFTPLADSIVQLVPTQLALKDAA